MKIEAIPCSMDPMRDCKKTCPLFDFSFEIFKEASGVVGVADLITAYREEFANLPTDEQVLHRKEQVKLILEDGLADSCEEFLSAQNEDKK